MKKIKEFENKRLSINSLKSIIGGESSCTLVTNTSEGECWDQLRETTTDSGEKTVELIVRNHEQAQQATAN